MKIGDLRFDSLMQKQQVMQKKFAAILKNKLVTQQFVLFLST
jgi:hypothetical protein